MRRKLRLLLWVPVVTVGGMLLLTAMRNPSLDRDWDEDVRVLAGVEQADDGAVRLSDIRDWRYTIDAVVDSSYFDASYDPRDIVDVWMYEQILDERGLIAHTFVVFEFDESYGPARNLGISVETRRESGETYSLIGGMLRSFEVTHIWATERDLVTRRVQYLDYPLRRYRLEIPEEHRATIFTKFAQETSDLAISPRWYNTVSRNCTSSLIRYVNESRPDAIPFHYSWIFTGKVDDYLAELGFLDPESMVAVTRESLASSELRGGSSP